jgi:protocatechuate 3,4-dioxygenase beta subunit
VLTGRVLESLGCRPVRGAIVDFWQAGRNGYQRSGRGSVVTGADGRFRFEGPVPPSYNGRAGHVHIRVAARGYEQVITEYVFRPGRKSGQITIVLESLL